MSGYKQLTQIERYHIRAYLIAGMNQSEMSRLMGRNKSTISRELRRNRGKKGYRPLQAHSFAMARTQHRPARTISVDVWKKVIRYLKADWSPEQVSNMLKKEKIHISHSWIYNYVEKNRLQGGLLHKHLRTKTIYRKRYNKIRKADEKIKNRISIHDRPKIINDKKRYGDFEIDCILSKRQSGSGALLTIVERKSKYVLIEYIPHKKADFIKDIVVFMMKGFKRKIYSITADNGGEFARHEEIAKRLNIKFYFADPFSSYQRGVSENTNGLIRQYFPKGSSFAGTTKQKVQWVMNRLNNRPRKTLGYKSPNQILFGIKPVVALGG